MKQLWSLGLAVAILLAAAAPGARAKSLKDYLKNDLVNRFTQKVLSQASVTVTVENSALWQTPLPYYLTLYKSASESDTGYNLQDCWTLTLQPDVLHPDQVGPARQEANSVTFEWVQTLAPGSYRLALHNLNEINPRTRAGSSPWLLPQFQDIEVAAKPKHQTFEFFVQGYPEIQTE